MITAGTVVFTSLTDISTALTDSNVVFPELSEEDMTYPHIFVPFTHSTRPCSSVAEYPALYRGYGVFDSSCGHLFSLQNVV